MFAVLLCPYATSGIYTSWVSIPNWAKCSLSGCCSSGIGFPEKLMSSNRTGLNWYQFDVRFTILVAPGSFFFAAAMSFGMTRLVKRKWPMWLAANWYSIPCGVRVSFGMDIWPALLIKMSRWEIDSFNSFAAFRIDSGDPRSSSSVWIATAGKSLLRFFTTSSTLCFVREVRMRRAGFSDAIARAVAVPSPSGFAPVMRTAAG